MAPSYISDFEHMRRDAQVLPGTVIETYYISDATTGQRRVPQTKTWTVERSLGHGGFGEVRLEVHASEKRAVKRMWATGSVLKSQYERELKALLEFSKPKYKEAAVFVEFFGWFEDADSVYLSMEYIPLGDLEDNVPLKAGAVKEREMRDIVKQILEGLKIMHLEDFVHRDLKPKNILVCRPSPQWWVKLADFGLSKKKTEDTAYRTQAGTTAYMAPEVLNFVPGINPNTSEYTNAVDIWGLGCILYRLAMGCMAFPPGPALGKYCESPSFLSLNEAYLGQLGVQFVKDVLVPFPAARLTAQQALEHAWITTDFDISESSSSNSPSLSQSDGELPPSFGMYDTPIHAGLQSYDPPLVAIPTVRDNADKNTHDSNTHAVATVFEQTSSIQSKIVHEHSLVVSQEAERHPTPVLKRMRTTINLTQDNERKPEVPEIGEERHSSRTSVHDLKATAARSRSESTGSIASRHDFISSRETSCSPIPNTVRRVSTAKKLPAVRVERRSSRPRSQVRFPSTRLAERQPTVSMQRDARRAESPAGTASLSNERGPKIVLDRERRPYRGGLQVSTGLPAPIVADTTPENKVTGEHYRGRSPAPIRVRDLAGTNENPEMVDGQPSPSRSENLVTYRHPVIGGGPSVRVRVRNRSKGKGIERASQIRSTPSGPRPQVNKPLKRRPRKTMDRDEILVGSSAFSTLDLPGTAGNYTTNQMLKRKNNQKNTRFPTDVRPTTANLQPADRKDGSDLLSWLDDDAQNAVRAYRHEKPAKVGGLGTRSEDQRRHSRGSAKETEPKPGGTDFEDSNYAAMLSRWQKPKRKSIQRWLDNNVDPFYHVSSVDVQEIRSTSPPHPNDERNEVVPEDSASNIASSRPRRPKKRSISGTRKPSPVVNAEQKDLLPPVPPKDHEKFINTASVPSSQYPRMERPVRTRSTRASSFTPPAASSSRTATRKPEPTLLGDFLLGRPTQADRNRHTPPQINTAIPPIDSRPKAERDPDLARTAYPPAPEGRTSLPYPSFRKRSLSPTRRKSAPTSQPHTRKMSSRRQDYSDSDSWISDPDADDNTDKKATTKRWGKTQAVLGGLAVALGLRKMRKPLAPSEADATDGSYISTRTAPRHQLDAKKRRAEDYL